MAKAAEIISIEVLNWGKHNARKDVKNPTWFRLNHNLFNDQEFHDVSCDELCVWLYILCLASQKSSGIVSLYVDHAISTKRFTKRQIFSALKKLERNGNVLVLGPHALRPRNVHVTDTCSTDRQTDRQNTTDKHAESDEREKLRIRSLIREGLGGRDLSQLGDAS